jgi:ABC-type sulfate transport system permease component
MGTTTGLITVLTFVGLPFHINAARNGFQAIPERLENVSALWAQGLAGLLSASPSPWPGAAS